MTGKGRRARRSLALTVAAVALAAGTAGPAVLAADGLVCEAPDLGPVRVLLAAADVAGVAGDGEGVARALVDARDELSRILAACEAGPRASLGPVELSRTLELDTFTVGYPATLEPLPDDVVSAAEGAEAATFGDSPETGELLRGGLDSPLPETARVVAVLVGAADAILRSAGAGSLADGEPLPVADALTAIVTQLVEGTSSGPTRFLAGEVTSFRFPDDSAGAEAEGTLASPEGETLAAARFVLRELGSGHWAMAIVVAPPPALAELSAQALAMLASVTLR